MEIGLQLYTLRNEGDLAAQLDLCQDAQINLVETAGFHDLSCKDLINLLQTRNFTVKSAHIGLEDLRDRWDDVILYCKEMQITHCVFPYFVSEDIAEWRNLAKELKHFSQQLKQENINLAYHNHDHELRQEIDGQTIMDFLLAEVPLLSWEMDIAWVDFAEKSVEDYLQKYAKRIPLLHVKDYKGCNEDNHPLFCEIGAGDVAITPIVSLAQKLGVKTFLLENDDVGNAESFLKNGRAYLQKIGER